MHFLMKEACVRTRILAICAGVVLLAACSGSPAPETSNVSVNDSSIATTTAEVDTAAAPRVPRRAPETRAADRPAVTPAPPPLRPVPEYREVVIPAGTI